MIGALQAIEGIAVGVGWLGVIGGFGWLIFRGKD